MGSIAASWVISPLMGGLIAAGFLYLIKRSITYKADIAAARSVVPLLVALMAWAFVAYILLKGVSKIWKTGFTGAALIGLAVAVLV
jgi:PiT family inorganic phosphate transporter